MDEFVHSKVCAELCAQPCAKKYANSSELEDEITHWSILSPSLVYPPTNSSVHFIYKAKSYGENAKIQCNLQYSESPQQLNTRPANEHLSQLFFKKFDSVKPQLKFEPDYNELTDVGTTYLDKNGTDHSSPFILEESFPCDPYAWTTGILPDFSQVTVQIDTGATKCIMSKGFYDAYPILHSLPKYKPYMTTLEIGDGSQVPVNFIIPLIISFKDHTFEIYTLVNGSTNNKLLLLGMKNAVEIEGVICARTFQLKLLNRSAPLFPTQSYIIPTGQKHSVKLNVAFPFELGSMAIIQIIHNQVVLENNCTYELYFLTHLQIGIVITRSLGYFHIPHETIAKSLSQYKTVTANHMQVLMNKVSTSVKEAYMPKASNTDIDQCPWLDPKDPQRHMTDEEILYKTTDLSKSVLDENGKKKLMAMVIKQRSF